MLVGCGGLDVEFGINILLMCEVFNVFNDLGMVCVFLFFIQCEVFIVFNEINDVCVVGVDFVLLDFVFIFLENQVVFYYNCVVVDVDNLSNDLVYEGW